MKFNELVMAVEADISDNEEDVLIHPGYYDRVAAGRYTVFRKSPFLGVFLRNLAVVTTFDVDTMAVSDTGNIYINPKFGMELSFDEFVGVLAHEAMHIVNFTFRRRRGRQPRLWNIATDFIMNRDLLDSGFILPRQGCIPVRSTSDKYIVQITTKLEKVMDIDITDSSAEELYEILKDNLREEDGEAGEGEGEGEGEGKGKGKGEGKGGGLSTIDDHIMDDTEEDSIVPTDGSEAKKKNTLEDLKRKSAAASQASKSGHSLKPSSKSEDNSTSIEKISPDKGRGGNSSLKSSIDIRAEKLLKPEINWRVVLKNIITKSSVVRTMSRPHRRTYGGGPYMPRKKMEDELGFCCLAMDTSGSIDKQLLSKFAGEIVSLTRQFPNVSVLVCLWTVEVYYAAMIDKNSAPGLAAAIEKAYKTGGDRLSSVAKWLQSSKYNKKVRAVIYLTDGGLTPDDTYIMSPPVQSIAFIPTMGGFGELNIPGMKVFYINTDI